MLEPEDFTARLLNKQAVFDIYSSASYLAENSWEGMNGDPQALCSDSGSIFTLNSKPKQRLFSNSRELFMDSPDTDYDSNRDGTNQNSSGLLRFRLAPGSSFENFSHGVDKNGNNSTGNHGLNSKFNLGGTNGGLVSQGSLNLEESSKGLINGSAVLNSQLPPQYPRKISSVTSVGMDHQGQAKLVSSLMRQNSSPPGLFSPQNGTALATPNMWFCHFYQTLMLSFIKSGLEYLRMYISII